MHIQSPLLKILNFLKCLENVKTKMENQKLQGLTKID